MINFVNIFNNYMTEQQYCDVIDIDVMKQYIIEMYFRSFAVEKNKEYSDPMYQYFDFTDTNHPKGFISEINTIFEFIANDIYNEEIDIPNLRNQILKIYYKYWEWKSIVFTKYVRPVNILKIQK